MMPAPGKPVRRAAEYQVGDQSQGRRHDQRLAQVNPPQDDGFVYKVNDNRRDEDLGNVVPAFPQQPAPIGGIGEDGPAVGGSSFPGVPQPGADREDGGNQRLDDDSEREGTLNPPDKMFQMF